MKAIVVAELRMKRRNQHVGLAAEDGRTIDLGQNLDVGPYLFHHRGANEHRPDRRSGLEAALLRTADFEVGLEGVDLAPVAVAANDDIDSGEAHLIGLAVSRAAQPSVSTP